MIADFSELRVKMVDGQVRTTDVTDAALLDAMLAVPREAFVGPAQQALAYIDEDIRISDGGDGSGARYLMEPSPLAKLLQLAEIGAGDSVLDVGCGTGYCAALLGQLAEGGRLVAVEGQGNAGVARLFVRAGGVVTGRRAFNAAIKPLPGFERIHAFEF